MFTPAIFSVKTETPTFLPISMDLMKLLEGPPVASRLDCSCRVQFKPGRQKNVSLSYLEYSDASEDQGDVVDGRVVGHAHCLPLEGVDVVRPHNRSNKRNPLQVKSEGWFFFIIKVAELKVCRVAGLKNIEIHVEEHADGDADSEAVVRSGAGNLSTGAIRSSKWKSDYLDGVHQAQ